jgi:hypothetical protein
MDITYEEAESMLQKRLQEYPESGVLVNDPYFKESISKILDFLDIEQSFFPLIENKVVLVLAFYTPISSLAEKIATSTGLPLEKCSEIVSMVDSILLDSVRNDLYAFDYLWEKELEEKKQIPEANSEFKERLDLRPEGRVETQPEPTEKERVAARPLTREELMSALAPKRTMASDIEAVRQKSGQDAPAQGYEAHHKEE